MEVKTLAVRIRDAIKWKIQSFFQKLFRSLPFVFAALALCGIVFSAIQITLLKAPQYDQYAAERWSTDSGKTYRQVSVIARSQLQGVGLPPLFIDTGVSLNKSMITELRTALETLISSSGGQEEKRGSNEPKTPVGARKWVDAYYTDARAWVQGMVDGEAAGVGAETVVTGISGNYYLFHPRELLAGSFLTEEPLEPQNIVLNEQLAWLLYKSTDVVGQSIRVGAGEFIIIGVVRDPGGKIDRTAGMDKPRAYIYFDELASIDQSADHSSEFEDSFDYGPGGPSQQESKADNIGIFCYEAVLPDPIDGIAYNDLKSSLMTYIPSEENFYFINNTDRFGLLRIASGVFPIGKDALIRSKFTFPECEISAQITEQHLTVWWSILAASTLFMVISLLAAFLTIRKRRSASKIAEPNDREADESDRPARDDEPIRAIRRV